MKKLLFFMLILVLAVSSCNFLINDEYGELVLGFDGSLPDGSRALDSNGLPILASSRLEVRIIGESGSIITRSLKADEPKSLVELVPIGEKVEITVTAYNPSAQWSGKKTHTVTSGQNRVTVLLSKKASGLNNLLFTQTKVTNSQGVPSYSLTLHMDGKPINNVPESTRSEHIFSRDSKGRLYVGYTANEPNDPQKLVRYTSEGVEDKTKKLSLNFLANDYTTGKMYGLSGRDLKEIDEDLNDTSVSLPPSVGISVPFAADKGIFTWANLGSSVIHLWKSGMSTATSGGFHTQAGTYHLNNNAGFKVKDIFIRGSYVYVLFAGVNDTINPANANIHSFGAVLKWKIGTDPNGGHRFEGNPEIIGMEANPAFANGVLQDYDYSKNFYGAVKVIGFDDENLYIADDGFDAAMTDAGPKIIANRNRIAILNMQTNELTFTDAGTAKWNNEWKEWKAPNTNTKTIVWDWDGSSNIKEYYAAEPGDRELQGDIFGNSESDVFCYDALGNIYIASKFENNLEILYYEPSDSGYENAGNKQIDHLPKAMAVSIFPKEPKKNILYYYENGSTIKTISWEGDEFQDGRDTGDFTLGDLSLTDTITALAANKDGVFAAVKRTLDGDKKYSIEVRKYAHYDPQQSGSVSALRKVSVVPVTNTNRPEDPDNVTSDEANAHINEELNALYIHNGILYGLTTKQKGVTEERATNEVFIGGKLLKIGITSQFPNSGNADLLYENDGLTPSASGEFAPYRFISVEPNQLVIASDGYYGKKINPEQADITNKNNIFVFDIGRWADPKIYKTPSKPLEQPELDFSKKLEYINHHGDGYFKW